MAKVLDIFSLLKEKEQDIRTNGQSWMDFLVSSSYTNKYNYNDQILIYANKPDARACASMGFWNKRFKRWINKGAKGIPLLEITDSGENKIKYIFDISDTHPTKYTKEDVKLWQFDDNIHDEAFTNLENGEGLFYNEEAVDLETRIYNIAKKRCEYFSDDMIYDIKLFAEGTFIEELDAFNIEVMGKELLIKSAAYQLMERMGTNPKGYFDEDDFSDITNFNSSGLTSILSTTISKISKEFIADLSKEIDKIIIRQKNVHNSLKDTREVGYNEDETNKTKTQSTLKQENELDEGGNIYGTGTIGRNPIQSGRGDLQSDNKNIEIRDEWRDVPNERGNINTESIGRKINSENDRNLWQSEEEISRGKQTGDIFDDDYRRQIADASSRRGKAIAEDTRDGNTEVDESLGSDRKFEKGRSDEMGGAYEQYKSNNRGNDLQRNSIRIEPLGQISLFQTEKEQMQIIEETVDDESAVFLISQAEIDEELVRGSGFQDGKFRIYDYYMTDPLKKDAVQFLKNEYGTGGRSGSNETGKVGYSSHDSKGIRLVKENSSSPDAEILLKWSEVEKRIRFLIAEDRYLIPFEKEKLQIYYAQHSVKESNGLNKEVENKTEIIDPDENPSHLFTDRMKELTPKLYGTESIEAKDKIVQAIYFVPFRSNWSWYLVEYDEKTGDCYGLVAGLEPEWGYFNIDELKDVGAERLVNFVPKTFEELKETELKNQLTSEELGRVFYGTLRYDNLLGKELKEIDNSEDLTSGQVGNKLENHKKAVGVGYSFNIFDEDILKDIDLEETITNVVVGSIEYKLYKAKTYEESKKVDDLLDTYGELSVNEYDSLSQENNVIEEVVTDKLKISYYIIEDLSTWSSNASLKSKLERFDNLEDAVSKFKEYRSNDYDYSDGKAKLTMGASIGISEIDIIHVRSDENYLVSDFTNISKFTGNEEFLADLLKLEKSVEFDKIRIFKNEAGERLKEPLTLEYRDWNNTYLKNEKININEYDLMFGKLGNGTTIWNRNNIVGGDYETIAHIGEDGEIKFYRDDLPDEVKSQIEIKSDKNDKEISIKKLDYQISNDELGVGTSRDKSLANIKAIRTLKKIESEDKTSNFEEQGILADYVGWGGLSEVFDEDSNLTWAKSSYQILKEILTDDEFKSARESTLNAHYTSPTIIRAMYQGLEKLGFKTGNILEPSCGTGNFIGMIPENMNSSKFYGVELDDITGRIAKQLYQNSNITIDGFENTNMPDDFFDVAIGNVPFGDYKVYDKKYEKEKFLIHDFFFAKTLDKVRAGGIIAFITSKGTLDKKSENVRKYIAKRAEFLGAIRLPNNAFKANAGTEVTSDIIFLKKCDRLVDIEPEWIQLGTDDNGIGMNQYFVEHPEMILGNMEMESTRFGMASTCKPILGADLSEQLAIAIENIKGYIDEVSIETFIEKTDESLPADPTVRNFSYTTIDGEVFFRENSVMIKPDINENDIPRLKGLIEIRDATRELVRLQMEEFSETEIKQGQFALTESYDQFVKKYGYINDKKNSKLFNEDVSYALICSLENLDIERGTVTKADMFTKRTIKNRVVPTHVDKPIEALAVSVAEKARVDMPYMESLTDISEEDIFKDLHGIIFQNPRYKDDINNEKYFNADEYLSGNIREKLEDAKLAAKRDSDAFKENVLALESVMPKALEATDIDVRLGATWLPTEDIEKFIFEILDTPGYAKWDIKVYYSPFLANWNVEGKSIDRSNIKATMTYGTDRVNAYKIIEDALNLKDTRVFDRVTDIDGNVKSVLNKKETMLAGQKQDLLKEAFKEWLWKEPNRRNRLTKIYNEKFNSIRPREFDGSHISFEGMNPSITLREHQKNAIAHTLYGGNLLLGHVVGAGKSMIMIASAMESKRLGLSQKSLFVVPNHLTEQMGGEFLKLYPSANILVATKKDFEPKNRKKFCGRIATGDYDAVIIGHSQFERIPMSVERQQSDMERQIDSITNGITDLKTSSGNRFSIKQLEKTKKSLSVKLQKLNDQSRKDDVVTFEELGVDRLIVDEAHSFKNLFLYTKMRNVAGIGQTEAKKSSDMFMKCRYMDEITKGKGIIFATGTPISNSITELYTMQRYLQYGALKKHNLEHFDAWASTFGETTTTIELSPEGTGYRPKTRFSKFYNLPELMNIFKEVADIKTSDMLNLPVPEAEFETIVIKPSEHQKSIVESLSERADMVRSKLVDSTVDNMLTITNDGRKLALDQRLINPMLPRDEYGKVAVCANNVFKVWHETKEKKSSQLVFCDLSTPKGNGKFNVYDDLKDRLIDKGISKKEIAFIHDAKNERQKDELFAKVRSGDIRILVGSTMKMGAGTNVQDKLIATHDLDCPWKPSDLEQRAGRLIRQGNENSMVKVFRYVTENTFDSYLWQLVENKQRFISQVMTSKSAVRSAEDLDESTLSYAEIKALATGNPLIKNKMNLDVQVSKLKIMQSNYLSNKYSMEDKIIKQFPNEIKRLEGAVAGFSADVEKVNANTVKGLNGEKIFNAMTVKDLRYGQLEKEDAGKALLKECSGVKGGESKEIGEYRGFKMELSYDSFFNQFNLNLKGDMNHRITLGTDIYGNITRIDNALDNIESKLEETKEKLEGVKQQLKNAKIEVKKPFAMERELKEKVKRLSELDHLLNMADNIDEPINEVSEMDKAKDYIMDYISKEYEEERKQFEFENLERIEIAYTTTEDEKYGIQATIDLVNYAVNTYIDDTLVHTDSYESLEELNKYELQYLDYSALVHVDDEDVERVEKIKKDDELIIDEDADLDESGDSQEKETIPSLLGQLRKNYDAISSADEKKILCKNNENSI